MNIHEKVRYPKDEHLTILRVSESAYLIEDDRNATAYVVTGSNRALVVDTCFGYEDYAEVVAYITDLPVIVVNTHAHGDHCGGNGYFKKAFIGEAVLQDTHRVRFACLTEKSVFFIQEIRSLAGLFTFLCRILSQSPK